MTSAHSMVGIHPDSPPMSVQASVSDAGFIILWIGCFDSAISFRRRPGRIDHRLRADQSRIQNKEARFLRKRGIGLLLQC